MKNKIINISLLIIFSFFYTQTAYAFPGTKEYNWKYNKLDYVYILPTYAKSWGDDHDFRFDYNTKSIGFLIGLAGDGVALEYEFQKDKFNFTNDLSRYTNIAGDGFDMKFTFLFQANLTQGGNSAIAPYIGTGVTYSRYHHTYDCEYSYNNISSYEYNEKGFGWQVYKIGLKIAYRDIIADIGADYVLGLLMKGNLYFSLGLRF